MLVRASTELPTGYDAVFTSNESQCEVMKSDSGIMSTPNVAVLSSQAVINAIVKISDMNDLILILL
jgi:hypothetical protein